MPVPEHSKSHPDLHEPCPEVYSSIDRMLKLPEHRALGHAPTRNCFSSSLMGRGSGPVRLLFEPLGLGYF